MYNDLIQDLDLGSSECPSRIEDLQNLVRAIIVRKSAKHRRYLRSCATFLLELRARRPEFQAKDGAKTIKFNRALLMVCGEELENLVGEMRQPVDTYKGEGHATAAELFGQFFSVGLLSVKAVGEMVSYLLAAEPSPTDAMIICACLLLEFDGPDLTGTSHGKVLKADLYGRLLDLKSSARAAAASAITYLFDLRDVPLHWAAILGKTEDVARLVEGRAQIDATSAAHFEASPLHLAAVHDRVETSHVLMDLKANLASVNGKGWVPLHIAASFGHVDIMANLLQARADPFAATTAVGLLPLHLAAWNGKTTAVATLIARLVDPDVIDKHGSTPLHDASRAGRIETVVELLKLKASPCAVKQVQLDTPLHHAATAGHVEIAAILLQFKARVSARNVRGYTPLHVAAINGHGLTCFRLVHLRACMSEQSDLDNTALHMAAACDHIDVLQRLVELRAQLEPRNCVGETPLHRAARFGCAGTVLKLVNMRANLSAVDQLGQMPVHLAAKQGSAVTAALLQLNASSCAPGCLCLKVGPGKHVFAIGMHRAEMTTCPGRSSKSGDEESETQGDAVMAASYKFEPRIVRYWGKVLRDPVSELLDAHVFRRVRISGAMLFSEPTLGTEALFRLNPGELVQLGEFPQELQSSAASGNVVRVLLPLVGYTAEGNLVDINSCPEGHRLLKASAPEKLVCDCCQDDILTSDISLSCHACDFDICNTCVDVCHQPCKQALAVLAEASLGDQKILSFASSAVTMVSMCEKLPWEVGAVVTVTRGADTQSCQGQLMSSPGPHAASTAHEVKCNLDSARGAIGKKAKNGRGGKEKWRVAVTSHPGRTADALSLKLEDLFSGGDDNPLEYAALSSFWPFEVDMIERHIPINVPVTMVLDNASVCAVCGKMRTYASNHGLWECKECEFLACGHCYSSMDHCFRAHRAKCEGSHKPAWTKCPAIKGGVPPGACLLDVRLEGQAASSRWCQTHRVLSCPASCGKCKSELLEGASCKPIVKLGNDARSLLCVPCYKKCLSKPTSQIDFKELTLDPMDDSGPEGSSAFRVSSSCGCSDNQFRSVEWRFPCSQSTKLQYGGRPIFHMKFMILSFRRFVRVVISSFNLSCEQWRSAGDVFWWVDAVPNKGKPASRFATDLSRILDTLECPEAATLVLESQLDIDDSVTLIASMNGQADSDLGLQRMKRALSYLPDFPEQCPADIQVWSMGGAQDRWFIRFGHVMAKSLENVRFIFGSGNWFASSSISRARLWKDPDNVLRDDRPGLDKVPWGWHSKVMVRSYPLGQCCGRMHGWVYLGSHNCSAHSWGDLRNPIANWELGILICSPPCIGESSKCGCDLAVVPLPFNRQTLRHFRSDEHPKPQNRPTLGTCAAFWKVCRVHPPGDFCVVDRVFKDCTGVWLKVFGLTSEVKLSRHAWCDSGFPGIEWPPPTGTFMFVELAVEGKGIAADPSIDMYASWVCSRVIPNTSPAEQLLAGT
ncbi:unnamed protein product [Polarella glacialis]|uniref:Uncharacterized protein n=1 Tax=Polarella glacialis TaxID=89957 RepID=A0A813FTU8_POLGL|nr:unnamed protein product [Polarella glacialis]